MPDTPSSSTFVIVAGVPLTGGRQFASYLSGAPNVGVHGEVHVGPFIRGLSMVQAMDELALGTANETSYLAQRDQMLKQLVVFTSRGRGQIKPDATIPCLQCPGLEQHYEKITSAIAPNYQNIRWLITVRNFRSTYFAHAAQPWFHGRRIFYQRYIDSLNTAIKMHEAFERQGTNVRVAPLVLEEHLSAERPVLWLQEHLFQAANLQLSNSQAWNIYRHTENRYASDTEADVSEMDVYDPKDRKFFARHLHKTQKTIRAFNETFGTKLTTNIGV